jgi:hypothetical protein
MDNGQTDNIDTPKYYTLKPIANRWLQMTSIILGATE